MVLLEILQNSQENTCVTVSLLVKFQAETCNFIIKETLAQVFFREFWEISKNNFFNRAPVVACFYVSKLASETVLQQNLIQSTLVDPIKLSWNFMAFSISKLYPQKLSIQSMLMTGVISGVVMFKDKTKSNPLANQNVRSIRKSVVSF